MWSGQRLSDYTHPLYDIGTQPAKRPGEWKAWPFSKQKHQSCVNKPITELGSLTYSQIALANSFKSITTWG